MKYRNFGTTGVKVSEVSIGGHREGVDQDQGLKRYAKFYLSKEKRAKVVAAAIDLGVNYFDTTYGCELKSLGESLKIINKRDNLFVSGMRVDFYSNMVNEKADPKKYTRSEVESRIKEFGFPHIDQFMLGAIEGGDPLKNGIAQIEDSILELFKLKKEGKIRFTGFSCHSPDYAVKMLKTFPFFDSAMVPYNFANRSAENSFQETIKKTGKAFVAMKPMVWHLYGIPVTALREMRGKNSVNTSAEIGKLAIKYILQNKFMSTCVPAMNTIEEVRENVSASGSGKVSAKENEILKNYAEAMANNDAILLAICGLKSDNLRVLVHAVEHIQNKMFPQEEKVCREKKDFPEKLKKTAKNLLKLLKKHPEWSYFV